MNHQQPSALSSSPETCALTLTREDMLDIRTALIKSTETCLPEEKADFKRRVLLKFKFNAVIKTLTVLLILILSGVVGARAQSAPTIYIDGPEEFSTAITAALNKKHVPVQVTLDDQQADYVLHAAGLQNKTETGKSQVARCLFMDCIGAFGSSSVSVTLVKANSPAVLWAYQVRKQVGGPLGAQSLSEAIAKHLKHDYFKD
jgi:hypothetical protein